MNNATAGAPGLRPPNAGPSKPGTASARPPPPGHAVRQPLFPSHTRAGITVFSLLLVMLALLWTFTYQSILRDRENTVNTAQTRLAAINFAMYAQIESTLELARLFMTAARPGPGGAARGVTETLGPGVFVNQVLRIDSDSRAVISALHPLRGNDGAIARRALDPAAGSRLLVSHQGSDPSGLPEEFALIAPVAKADGGSQVQIVFIDSQRLRRTFGAHLQQVGSVRLYADDGVALPLHFDAAATGADAASAGAIAASQGYGAVPLRVESTYSLGRILEPHGERARDQILAAIIINLLLAAAALLALRLAGYLRQYGIQLEMGRMHAEQASQIKTRFISQISHELRTPLHGIIGHADLVKQETADPLQRESADAILQSGEHLLSLVNQLLDATKTETRHKFEQGEDALTLLPIDIVPIVQQIVFSHEAAARRRSLDMYVNAPTSVTVIADRIAIGRILHNLLSNAIKFTLRGGVRIEVKRLGDRARIEVIDTGIGVPPEDQPRLFGMFVQGSAVDVSRFGGTGLGLYLTRQLVESMGGRIGFESRPGAGSTFWFELPLAETEQPDFSTEKP